MDPEYHRLDQLLHHGDPETALPRVLEYVSREATNHNRWAEAATLVEDLVYLHAHLFIDRIEAEAATNQRFRLALSQAYIVGIGGACGRTLPSSQRDISEAAR